MSFKNFDKIDITQDEFEKLNIALKKEEFMKLFVEYCEEIQDPENRKQYEAEIRQLEAERGVDVTFLYPEPGFVVKTSVNGDTKCFINIAKCDKVSAPTKIRGKNPKDGKMGVNWSIPNGLPPPRDDFDNKNQPCRVFDVIFHPDALSLSENNSAFRQCLIDTACNGIEREYKVQLDRANLKFLKLKFKGVQRSSLIRKLAKNAQFDFNEEPSPLDKMFPPKPKPNVEPVTVLSTNDNEHEEYCTPKYSIKYRRPLDMSEMTFEIDAKINVTIPKELVVEIELPLLNSAVNCTLDVTDKILYFMSEKPAKYKLNIELPYDVNDKNGSARFNSDKRQLEVTLPVKTLSKERRIKDLYREDSGVETDIREDMLIKSKNTPVEVLQVEMDTKLNLNEPQQIPSSVVLQHPKNFLQNSIEYIFPERFDLNILDDTIAIVLHVRNVENNSIDLIKDRNFFHVKFTSIGAGYYPTNYAFYFKFLEENAEIIDSINTEAWDNNVVLSFKLKNFQNIEYYHAGVDKNNIKMFRIQEEFIFRNEKQNKTRENQSKLAVSVELSDDEKSVRIEIKPRKENAYNFEQNEEDYEKLKFNSSRKKQKGKNKKIRCSSESACYDIKEQSKKSTGSASKNNTTQVNYFKTLKNTYNSIDENSVSLSSTKNEHSGGEGYIEIPNTRKQRSYSESQNQSAPLNNRGILKHNSRYSRNMSESCLSIDEPTSYSVDGGLSFSHSFNDIPEENSQHGLSESGKKTVRFSDVIKKNFFRLDSSILGRRKINQKKKNKKRALQRRLSEGDTPHYEEKATNNKDKFHEHYGSESDSEKKSSKHDSGLDLSTRGILDHIESESSDQDYKSSLMFDIDI